jgi:two-component system chemotaxis response regulator CheB
MNPKNYYNKKKIIPTNLKRRQSVAISSSGKKIRVLVVDDSLLMREIITKILEEDPAIEVVGTAEDPYDAREKIKVLNPDVMTLDIHMPKMDGLSFLEKVMTLRPMPVIMISTLTSEGAEETLRALELGAIDYIPKPRDNFQTLTQDLAPEIRTKVKTAAMAKVKAFKLKVEEKEDIKGSAAYTKTVFIGSSTGGVEALTRLITALPKECPPILIAQHMPPVFTKSFADRLNKISKVKVCEATHDEVIKHGNVYIAPGSHHMIVKHGSQGLSIELKEGEAVDGHKPSIDMLFESAASVLGSKALGIIMTGMGNDGAAGLKKMYDRGAMTFGQNEASCTVYGMSKVAKEMGGVTKELHLNDLASNIVLSSS